MLLLLSPLLGSVLHPLAGISSLQCPLLSCVAFVFCWQSDTEAFVLPVCDGRLVHLLLVGASDEHSVAEFTLLHHLVLVLQSVYPCAVVVFAARHGKHAKPPSSLSGRLRFFLESQERARSVLNRHW